MKYGKENSYTDSIIIKYDNLIIKIHNGSVQDKKFSKIVNEIYDELLENQYN